MLSTKASTVSYFIFSLVKGTVPYVTISRVPLLYLNYTFAALAGLPASV